MRIRTRKNLKRKNTAITLLLLAPLLGTLTVAGFVFYILYDVNSFTYRIDPPNTAYFYDMDDINMSRLEEMAHTFDYRLRAFNSPTGIAVGVTFKNDSYTYDAIQEWRGTDNGAEAVAYSLMPACYRHKVALEAGDMAAVDNATYDVKFYVEALIRMIAAPNGGFGINPETGKYYPGIISRFVCSYPEAVKYHPWMLEEHEKHFNGTGIYKNWRVRLGTSRDEVSAYYLAWSSVLKYVDPTANEDSAWCVEQIKVMVDQVLSHWKEMNWLVIDGHGYPTGSDINPADWLLPALRVGATALPEKYGQLYAYAAAKSMMMDDASMGDWMNAGFEYYGLGLGAQNHHVLIELEENPLLRYYYIKNYERGFHQIVKYHRQLYFNLLHLMFMQMLEPGQRAQFEDTRYTDAEIRWDFLDNMWRFEMSNWCPMRNYNLIQRPHSTRSTSLNPEIRARELDPSRVKWMNFFNEHPLGGMVSWLDEAFGIDKKIYLKARTVSEYWAGPMVWQNSPFENEGGNPNSDGLTEEPGNSYTLCYWLGRLYGVIPAS